MSFIVHITENRLDDEASDEPDVYGPFADYDQAKLFADHARRALHACRQWERFVFVYEIKMPREF